MITAAGWWQQKQPIIPISNKTQSVTDKTDAAFNVSTGYIIALDPLLPHISKLQKSAGYWLGIKNIHIQQAVNASDALELSNEKLPLYTRMILSTGRHDHMQLGSGAMIGCLLSHVSIW